MPAVLSDWSKDVREGALICFLSFKSAFISWVSGKKLFRCSVLLVSFGPGIFPG